MWKHSQLCTQQYKNTYFYFLPKLPKQPVIGRLIISGKGYSTYPNICIRTWIYQWLLEYMSFLCGRYHLHQSESWQLQQQIVLVSLIRLMKAIFHINNAEFNGKYYLHVRSIAMGMRLTPSYTNILIGQLEDYFQK